LLLEDLQKNFPLGVEIPLFLKKLLDYSNRVKRYYSGYFELLDCGANSLYYWFGKDEAAASQFAIFGHGGDGCMYGYWLYDNQTIETAPIIFLGSEGDQNKVLANDFKDFLASLAVGYEDLGYKFDRGEIELTEQLIHFRNWLETELGIKPVEDVEVSIEKAMQNHPSLENWLDDWEKGNLKFQKN